jgi:hypothetical protein
MNARNYFLILIFLFISFLGFADRNKSALSQLKKGKLSKAETLIKKTLDKDSLDPAANYIYSLLYIKDNFRAYSIDTSYLFINRAIDQYRKLDSKRAKKLQKLQISDSTLNIQRKFLDSLGFEVASKVHTISGYNFFIKQHRLASQVSRAIELRNEIAFGQATKINTYESYKYFIDTYPDAKQVKEASSLFEILLYEANIKDKRLSSYIQFLEDYPRTPYRDQAEKNILELFTLNNKNEDYEKFVKQYPDSKLVVEAFYQLFHNFKQDKQLLEFLNYYKSSPLVDSLISIVNITQLPLIPTLENGKYGFMDFSGKIIIKPTYNFIKQDYLCGNVTEEVLFAGSKEHPVLISRHGQVIFDKPFDDIEDLGYGLIKVRSGKKVGLVNQWGKHLLPVEYDDIKVIRGTFIKFTKNKKTGLASFSGRIILKEEFDDVSYEGDFIALEKGKRFAVTNEAALLNTVRENVPVKFSFIFDEIELLDPYHLLVVDKDKEGLINPKLEFVIPLKKQRIKEVKNIWLVKEEKGYKVFDKQSFLDNTEIYEDAVLNKQFLGLKKGKKWAVIETFGGNWPEFVYDSVLLLSEKVIITFSGETTYAVFDNHEKVDISHFKKFKLLKPVSADISGFSQYLLTENKTGFKKLFSLKGKALVEGNYSDIVISGNGYLILTHPNGKKSLADKYGKSILPARYEGIGNFNDGFFALLNTGKFGIINPEKNIRIEPEYEIGLQPYNGHYLVAAKGGKFGIIDFNNKVQVPFQFEEIKFWSDELALVKQGTWMIYDIQNKKIVNEGIDDWKYVYNNGKEAMIIYSKDANYGVLHNKRGEIIPATNTDIINVGTAQEPVFFTEKVIREADFYVVLYYNKRGEIFKKQAFTRDQYDKIICD